MKRAAEHGGDPSGGLRGRSADALMALFNRARRKLHKKRETLEDEKKEAALRDLRQRSPLPACYDVRSNSTTCSP